MLHIIEKLAYQIVENDIRGQAIQILTIHNSDGSPRWICPANAQKPYFLKFYNTGSSKARLIALAFKIIFFLRLQKLFFKTQRIYIAPAKDIHKSPLIDIFQDNWAIFTGTVGPNRKALVYQNNGTSNYFFKVAFNERSQVLIQKEAQSLEKVRALELRNIKIPLSNILSQELLQLEDVSSSRKRQHQITQTHIIALTEIYEKTRTTTPVKNLCVMQEIKAILEKLEKETDARLPKGLLKKLNKLYEISQYKNMEVAYSHGDFTPWNMYVSDDQLCVYDWELASENMPLGFDAFHFIIQQNILVERKPWLEIFEELDTRLSPAFQTWIEDKSWKDYLELYLLITTTQHLNIYSEQEKWHPQVTWLLETWSNAISDLLKYEEENRKLLILDFFDFIQEKNYATINFPNITPENLASNSDIDICIEIQDYKHILNFFKNHALTLYISQQRKSCMTSLKVFLIDDGILCLDLIWKIRRKALTMMNSKEVLVSAQKNEFGIKQMSHQHLARYIGLFYSLNHAALPTRHEAIFKTLEKSPWLLDFLLLQNKEEDSDCLKLIRYLLQQETFNQFPQNIYNTWSYLQDTIKQLLWNRGIIITFSGVDGAGKSTVIEHIKLELEKKLRKRVVVLRHRPSILPILSTWVKGKTQALKEASEGLPHRGKNKSTIGSLLRFAYYYTDYLLGQFYVSIRYLSRGYIVLYDRYYFDFIVDSKRSNIQIPQSISKFGYRFLLKPKLNFFLYADSEIILKRKQELNSITLSELTKNYLSLFEELDKKSNLKYFSIQNLKLESTIKKVMQAFILKMI